MLTPHLLQVEAALTGRTKCSLYVDTADSPQAAALRVDMCWYIVGHPSTEFLKSVNQLLPRDTYSVLVLGRSIEASQRAILCLNLYFVCAKSRFAERASADPIHHPLHEGYRVLPIDHQLLEGDLEGAALLKESILHE